MGETIKHKKGDWKEKRKGREEKRNEFIVTSHYDSVYYDMLASECLTNKNC